MKKSKNEITPDFFQIPYQLVMDKTLTPTDRIVYGAVYFFANMSGKRCFASNSVLAKLIGSSAATVSQSLNRLEERTYVIRAFSDPDVKANRLEIIPTITMNQKLPRHKVVANSTTRGVAGTEPIVAGAKQVYSKRYNGKNGLKPSFEKEETAQQSHEPTIEEVLGVVAPATHMKNTREKNDKDNITLTPGGSGPSENGLDNSTIGEDGKSAKNPPDQTNDAIALFLPILPGDFVGKSSAFAKPPTREAVGALLKRVGLEGIREMIKKYDAGKTDQYRPQVGTVYEFCTTKLAKVEAYVGKNTGIGTYASRLTSSPEHSKNHDELIRKKQEADREKMRLAKEEWERDNPRTT